MARRAFSPQYLRLQYKWLVFTLILVFLFGITVKATYGMYRKSKETEEKALITQKAVGEMEARHDAALRNMNSVSTDRGMDREIRERYGVKKPGEGVIILTETEEDESVSEE